jgi:hypothetical protein
MGSDTSGRELPLTGPYRGASSAACAGATAPVLLPRALLRSACPGDHLPEIREYGHRRPGGC